MTERNIGRDDVFKDHQEAVPDFTFNDRVAGVFDDMVSRSVPFYGEMQRMVAELAGRYAQPDTHVYDLGCSTGTTLLMMDKTVPDTARFFGVDESAEMINRCREKLDGFNLRRPVELSVADLTCNVPVDRASVVTMVLVLQFIRPMNRLEIVSRIQEGMVKGGVFLLVEKVLTEERSFNREFIDFYYGFKRKNKYSELEISQKREALENVLIPYRTSENAAMLRNAGFGEVEVFFRWYNFTGLIARKL
ncbi:carboxy-S-adenosyl-L-methionine synthase CmoA [Parapedobacter sp. ISTM3]|uniref:carboxy-S-adenosyl-L-methionine synthase CmoA n=1 Tax=Parapedobacter sp. ISTM3 TaxID=2800130 RepID=UPI001903AF20|nr:carboxy-S-adenosyl-L-methionine synthase CmoA [Parapedobacter sp. ISTM3]MBK1439876.1 carboxy-S-adenosyl-L-methionine synthase CmoA [Parapedobacter sp. ISTM3]